MLTETIAVALLISIIMGGKIKQLGELAIKEFWLVLLALLIQSAVYWLAVKGINIGPSWVSSVLDTLSYLLLLTFTFRNRSLPGMSWITLGIILNMLVIALNNGVMPVDPSVLTEVSRKALLIGQGTHGLMTETTRLKFLADIFYVNVMGLDKQLFSIGDTLIDVGMFYLIIKKTTKKSL